MTDQTTPDTTPTAPAPITDADLVATATEKHYIVDNRTDAMGNSPCVCDQWWDAAGDNPSWDQHLAEVALAALADAGRLAPIVTRPAVPIAEARVLAALDALGWRDDRTSPERGGKLYEAAEEAIAAADARGQGWWQRAHAEAVGMATRAEQAEAELDRARQIITSQAAQLRSNGTLLVRLRDIDEQRDRAWAEHDTLDSGPAPSTTGTGRAGYEIVARALYRDDRGTLQPGIVVASTVSDRLTLAAAVTELLQAIAPASAWRAGR